ncbi:MAG: undecaprenyl-diphosphatase [Actinomycetota bacterium]|nr:undecaprenyl-diphosphatase [Actinomycetota bacterium]
MSGAISIFDAVVLGVVEGLTEFLPVSSTGHLTITESLLGLALDDPTVTAYTAIIQFGAIVATFLYFRADFARMVTAWVGGLRDPERRQHQDYRFAWAVILGSLPIGVIGWAGRDLIEGPLRSLWAVAASLIGWSLVMWVAERRAIQKYGEEDLGVRQVLVIGLAQCLALVPGVSRSGATISGGLLLGTTRVAATRLSFFLAVPALTGAALFQARDIDTAVAGWGSITTGLLVSFAIAYASIAWLLHLVAKYPITVFVPYRVAAGLVLAGLLATGTISAT